MKKICVTFKVGMSFSKKFEVGILLSQLFWPTMSNTIDVYGWIAIDNSSAAVERE